MNELIFTRQDYCDTCHMYHILKESFSEIQNHSYFNYMNEIAINPKLISIVHHTIRDIFLFMSKNYDDVIIIDPVLFEEIYSLNFGFIRNILDEIRLNNEFNELFTFLEDPYTLYLFTDEFKEFSRMIDISDDEYHFLDILSDIQGISDFLMYYYIQELYGFKINERYISIRTPQLYAEGLEFLDKMIRNRIEV